jgi:EAL domain-containing protein (putative c-di-GMP-specific phosphodiesterase class I)
MGDAARRQLSRAVTAAHARGIPVVAKRVGTPAQREFAIDLGCDFLQGDAQSVVLPGPGPDLLRSAEQGLFGRPNFETSNGRSRRLDAA